MRPGRHAEGGGTRPGPPAARASAGEDGLARGGGPQVRSGQFRWSTQTDTWSWSRGLFDIYGYPGPVVVPTTALVLDHKDSGSRPRAAALLERARTSPSGYVNHHRIVDARGRTRSVLTIGSSLVAADEGLVSTGFVVDLTDVERAAGSAAVEAAAEGRTAITQSQGVVMAVLGLDPDAALSMLMALSQTHHVKLGALCRALVAALPEAGPVTRQDQLTRLLLQAAGAGLPGPSAPSAGGRSARPPSAAL